MSLATPSKIRELQIKLYRKAKSEPRLAAALSDDVWGRDPQVSKRRFKKLHRAVRAVA
jgi:hypothetical protein